MKVVKNISKISKNVKNESQLIFEKTGTFSFLADRMDVHDTSQVATFFFY